MTTSAAVRDHLTELLRLNLVGPDPGDPSAAEVLPEGPTRWYLTGFLVPSGAPQSHRQDDAEDEALDALDFGKPVEDAAAPETASKRKAFFPSSIGVSVLVPKSAKTVHLTARWGEYAQSGGPTADLPATEANLGEPAPAAPVAALQWTRRQRQLTLDLELPESGHSMRKALPDSDGVEVFCTVRRVELGGEGGAALFDTVPLGTRSVSVFLVNKRPAGRDRDEKTIFQAGLTLELVEGLVARPDMRGAEGADIDDRTAALQYRDVCEYAVGHCIATHATVRNGVCRRIDTAWVPSSDVARVVAGAAVGVELRMETLANFAEPAALQRSLAGLPQAYGAWIAAQGQITLAKPALVDTASKLLQEAEQCQRRIQDGISLLAEPQVFAAFQLANRAMALAARQRRPTAEPEWRLFQLAFVLLNLRSMAHPDHQEREVVELLFFPTGGGKTEAYLGLAAFTLILRRLHHPGITGAGVSVIMRYTLRLLTLDQLSRAATLICALELMRDGLPELGEWPFEIGLWVGLAATPNMLGKKGEDSEYTARYKVHKYRAEPKRAPSPIPLENCPWCDEKFGARSFALWPDDDKPTDLRIHCANPLCPFTRNRPLPIVAVDEPIYRRLPCFVIATVDKFAALPWVGRTAGLFGKVQRFDPARGFYGRCDPADAGSILPEGQLPPPDLIIQDELHLISGPLGTLAGLYEAAIETLCSRDQAGQTIRPKIVASTATIRRAHSQIRALFGRSQVQVFPPPGPNQGDLFFAKSEPIAVTPGRRYVGIAAPGRSLKVVLLRVYVTLLAAAQAEWNRAGGRRNANNPADPYLTLLGYFSSLRELGGSRRIVDDEVRTSLSGYEARSLQGPLKGAFANCAISEALELTSRVATDKVASARAQLASGFNTDDAIHVALATNMISVGLDIERLGLMVVLGQPKTTAEYIQATSRVGRHSQKPGLVVALLNSHRPRDRSHLERFEAYHQSFYRSVEVTSVTPFSPRALDRVLPAVTVALARLGHGALTAPLDAREMGQQRNHLQFVVDALLRRAEIQEGDAKTASEIALLKLSLRGRIEDLLDAWAYLATKSKDVSAPFEYGTEERQAGHLLQEPLSSGLAAMDSRQRKFTAPRSMRNVEPAVDIWVSQLDGADVEGQP